MDEQTGQARIGVEMAYRDAVHDLEKLSKASSADELDLLQAEVKATSLLWTLTSFNVSEAHERLAEKTASGLTEGQLGLLRLALDKELRAQQLVRVSLGDARGRLSDLTNRRLTQAAIDAASKTAGAADQTAEASRTTAQATVALAIATVVLILATIAAAIIPRLPETAGTATGPEPTPAATATPRR